MERLIQLYDELDDLVGVPAAFLTRREILRTLFVLAMAVLAGIALTSIAAAAAVILLSPLADLLAEKVEPPLTAIRSAPGRMELVGSD